MKKSRTFLEKREKLMRNIIKSLSIISVATLALALISCGPGVQTTGVNTNATTTASSDSTTYENYEPVNITESNATENTNYTNTTSKYGLLSSVLSSVDFTSLFAGIGSKMKEAAKQNSNCGQCTGSGCGKKTTSTPQVAQKKETTVYGPQPDPKGTATSFTSSLKTGTTNSTISDLFDPNLFNKYTSGFNNQGSTSTTSSTSQTKSTSQTSQKEEPVQVIIRPPGYTVSTDPNEFSTGGVAI